MTRTCTTCKETFASNRSNNHGLCGECYQRTRGEYFKAYYRDVVKKNEAVLERRRIGAREYARMRKQESKEN